MTQEEIEKYCQENQEKVNQYVAWLNYQIGFSGVGTTALDTPPDFPMPTNLPEEIKEELIKGGKQYAEYKWKCWEQTMRERLGEEVGAWVCPKLG